MDSRHRAIAAASVTVLVWASAFPFIRVALQGMAPVPLAAVRFAFAAVCMAAWWGWRQPVRPAVKEVPRFLMCGAIGIALYNICLNVGEVTVTASAASFIVNTVPVLTAVLAAVFLRERFTRWAWAGGFISFAGVSLIALSQPGGLRFDGGAIFLVGAALCQASFFVLQRPLIARHGAGVCASLTVIAGSLLLTPWLAEGISQFVAAPADVRWAVLALGVLPAALGYACWSVAQAYFGATGAANFLYLVPPVSTALAVVLTGEWPTWLTVLGGALAIAGVVMVNRRGRG